MFCKQLKQAGILRAPIQNNNSAHAAIQGCKRCFCFGNHAACDHAILRHLANLGGGEFGENIAVCILYARDICEQ